jgi:hypothetical protein
MGNGQTPFVCKTTGRCVCVTLTAIEKEFHEQELKKDPYVLWAIDFECAHENCGKRFSVCTIAEPTLFKDDLARLALGCDGKIRCTAEHMVSLRALSTEPKMFFYLKE